jgi:hypothetical protein
MQFALSIYAIRPIIYAIRPIYSVGYICNSPYYLCNSSYLCMQFVLFMFLKQPYWY